jgi:hypothetical protein
MKLPIMLSSPASCYFFPLKSKYSPQHPALKTYTINTLPSTFEAKAHLNNISEFSPFFKKDTTRHYYKYHLFNVV